MAHSTAASSSSTMAYRDSVSVHQREFASTSFHIDWREVMEGRDRQAELDAVVKFKYDEHSRHLAPLPLGTHVRVRDPPSSPEADGQNTDGEGGDERSSVDNPMAAGSVDGASVLSPLPTDTGNTEDADVPNKQPPRRSQRVRKRRVMFDV